MSVTVRAILTLGVGAAVSAPLRGQIAPPPASYGVSAWSIADGLPQTDVRTLAVDCEGYLWLGTNVGLTRFDGQVFQDYPRAGRVRTSEPIWALAPDGRGGLWALSPRLGPGRVACGGQVELPPGPAPPDFRFIDVAFAGGDTAWIATWVGVRLTTRGSQLAIPELPDGIAGEGLTLFADSARTLWVGGSAGLLRVSMSVRPMVERIRGLACNSTVHVVGAGDGAVWVATCRGVERVSSDGANAELVIPRSSDRVPTRLVAEGRSDGLWLADGAGVHRYAIVRGADGRSHARLTYENPLDLRGAEIVAMVSDGAGGVWVGTRTAGLRHVRRLRVRRLTTADGLPDRAVHHLAPDGADGLWIGTGRGLARWRHGRIDVTAPARLGPRGAGILGLFHDRSGGLWIGLGDGLRRMRQDGRIDRMLPFVTTPARDGSVMLEDRRGRIWFGTSRGDAGFFPSVGGRPVMLRPDLLPERRIWSMLEDGRYVWIGQEGMLSRFVDTTMDLRLTEQDGLPPGPVRGLHLDLDGSLWIATHGGGLARWQSGRGVTRVPPGEGRFAPLLSSLRIDSAGRFWVFGDGGLQVFRRNELLDAMARNRPPRVDEELGVEAGLAEGNAGYANTWFDAASGWVWLATVDGVAAVDTRAYPFSDHEAPVRIDEVLVDGVAAEPPDTIVVPPTPNALEIRFSTPQFGQRLNDRLRFRLVPHDRDWATAGSAAVARYSNLPPGQYLFEVTEGRPESWTNAVRRNIAVRVAPNWWQTAMARVIAVAFLLGGVWAVVQFVTRRLRARNRALQQLIHEREQAMRAASEASRDLAHVSRLVTAGELATSIAHELNQPLTAIMGNAQRARHLARRPGGDGLEPALEAIVDQTDRAAAVLRSLRAFVTKHPFEHESVAVERVVADSLRLLGDELARRGVSTGTSDSRKAPAAVRGNPVQLQQVLVNLLLNAADAMEPNRPSERVVTVDLADAPPNGVTLSVADRGPGISPSAAARVFEPFYTTKPNGLGLGLSLTRSIVEAHAGRIWIETPSEGGTVFRVYLPLVSP